MAAKGRALSIVLAIIAIFASSSASASIPRSTILDAPQVDFRAQSEEPRPSDPADDGDASPDNAELLHQALDTALIEPLPVEGLSETRVWVSRLERPLLVDPRPLLTDGLQKASAVAWSAIASDPTVLTPDPLGYQDSSNLYAFCGGDPVNCTDPTGESGWDPASWGHWVEKKVKTAKRIVGAVSSAITPQTGVRAIDNAIIAQQALGEATLNSAIDFVGGIPAGLLTIGEASGTAIAEEGCHDLYSCGMTGSAIVADTSATVLYAVGIAGAAESRISALRGPTTSTVPVSAPAVSTTEAAEEVARQARVARIRNLRESFSDANGNRLKPRELEGVKRAIRRIEAEGYELEGSVKYRGNQGIDLYFQGTGSNAGRAAFAEAKAAGGLGVLETDALGIRQGSYEFFRTRLARGIAYGDPAMRATYQSLYLQLRGGQVDLFGYFGRSGQLYELAFPRNVNFRSNPSAARLR